MPFLKRFSNLHWKLAVSYVGVTLLTVLTLEAIIILGLNWFGTWIVNTWVSQSALERAHQLAELAAAPLEAGSPDQLAQVLDQSAGVIVKFIAVEGEGEGDVTRRISDAWVVIGPQGRVIASNQPGYYPIDSPFAEPGLPEAERMVTETLAEGIAGSHLAEAIDAVVVAVPITDRAGKRLGALYGRQPTLDTALWSSSNFLGALLITTLVLLPCMIPLGLLFGFVTATGFTRRLRRLTQATDALAEGDLDHRVKDGSNDEIGQLAHQFNAMAAQIGADTAQLRELAERNARLARQTQRLAALEVRHRLAQELHDGVKQHLFGMNLATAAALNLLDGDPDAAHARLAEAQEHSRQAQAEMQALLNELRPAGLDERGLIAALNDYTATFGQRQEMQVRWHADVETDFSLPLTHEQALFRIAQEALTNVVRHAHATQVMVELRATPEAVELQVTDDGRGFDLSSLESGKTMGLQGMRERLMNLGGTLTIDTNPATGTRILAHLPRPSQTEEKAPYV